MANNVLFMVGADKGGVGKTTVSRTLIDYFTAHRVPVRAFDTQEPKGILKRFHPELTDVVDITSVPDQMRILDSIRSTEKLTVVDVRAGHLSWTLRLLQNIGFLDALKRAEIRLVLFHVLGSSISSLNEIAEVAPFAADAKYFLVKNLVNDATFFEWDSDVYDSFFHKRGHAVEITVPKLNEMAYEQVDNAAASFLSFIANDIPDRSAVVDSFVLRGYVRHWLSTIFSEYDRVNLREMVKPAVSRDQPTSVQPARLDVAI